MALLAFIFICLSTFITYSWKSGCHRMFCQELNPSNPLMKPPKLVNIKSSRKHIWQGASFVFFTSVHKAVTCLFAFLFVMHSLKSNCYNANGRGILLQQNLGNIKYCPNALILSIICTPM